MAMKCTLISFAFDTSQPPPKNPEELQWLLQDRRTIFDGHMRNLRELFPSITNWNELTSIMAVIVNAPEGQTKALVEYIRSHPEIAICAEDADKPIFTIPECEVELDVGQPR